MIFPKSLVLKPRKGAIGSIALPGSKSISNRMLLLAALADGVTTLSHVLDSDDTRVMIDSLQRLGVQIQQSEDCTQVNVQGVAGRFSKTGSAQAPIQLFIGNSGLTIRTLVPAIVAAISGTNGCVEISGVPRMHERPIGDLVDGLRAIGAAIDYLEKDGYPPLRIRGVTLAPKDIITVKGSTSSQFLTGLMQAAPLLALQWQREVTLAVDGVLISKPYVEITRATLARFGIDVQQTAKDPISYRIAPKGIAAAGALQVEGDASSASYFLAAGALGRGPVRVIGAGRASVQGDIAFAHALEKMGAKIVWGPDWIEASASGPLSGIDIDCNEIPDAAMTLVVCALFAQGATTLRNIGSWRVKETDRILAMATEARKLGAQVDYGDDWIRLSPPAALKAASIETYDDHRVAMSFALASFGNAPVTILEPGCVAKTFPGFFAEFSDLCARAVPVIAIDGPTASGKGTIASRVAQELGFGYLDSGALYRITALAARNQGANTDHELVVASIASTINIEFFGQSILLDGQDVTEAIRAEDIGLLASKVAALPAVRQALLLRQRDFASLPGLVADGRDMGSVVFAGARLKVFLTATPRARAERRYKQLIDKGFSCNLDSLSADLEARDARDASRAVAPLKPASQAVVIDSTPLSIDQVVQAVLKAWGKVA